MKTSIHKRWMKFTAIVVGCFGPLFLLASLGITKPAEIALDILSWPLDGKQTYDDNTLQFLSALTGGFLLGWGIMIWCLATWVYDLAPEKVRKSLLVGICTWFIFDSIGSIGSGNSTNAVWNAIVLIIGIGPMWLPAKNH